MFFADAPAGPEIANAALGSWVAIAFYVIASAVTILVGLLSAAVLLKKLRGKNADQAVIEVKLNAMQKRQAAMGRYTHKSIHGLRGEVHNLGLTVAKLAYKIDNGLAQNVAEIRRELKENTQRTDENFVAIEVIRTAVEKKGD